MSGIDDLIPPTRQVCVGGRDVEVGVLRMRQLPAFSKAIADPFPLIVMGDYLAVVMQYSEQVTEALRVATGLDAKFLGDLTPNDFLKLASAVFEVNLDFFARAVLPAAKAMGQMMTTALSVSPPSLSPGDTAMPTSST